MCVVLKRCQAALLRTDAVTFGVEESKELFAQLGVGHGLFEEGILFCQLLVSEVLCLPSHPVVVV